MFKHVQQPFALQTLILMTTQFCTLLIHMQLAISLVLLNANAVCVFYYLIKYAACQRPPGPLLFNKLD